MAVGKYAMLVGLALTVLGGCERPYPTRMAVFRTSLEGRTVGQRHNALKAARSLNGAMVMPKGVLSFNQRVGSWVRERGFVRAPVSMGGVLVLSWGGGVCQTATTVYGAALLGGLDIVERHPHAIAPSYVPMGMDAAVAFGVADLKIRNPFSFPVRLECEAEDNQLVCRVVGLMTRKQAKEYRRLRFSLRREFLSDTWVRLWRLHFRDGKLVKQELCHESLYLRH